MAEDDRVEDSFFQKAEKPDTGSGFFKAYQKPPSMAARIAIGVGLAAVLAGILIFTRRADQAIVWVLNPGPDQVHVEIGGNGHEVDPGKLVESRVLVEENFQVGAFKGEKTDDITVELKPEGEAVSLVDLNGDGAYVILDVSSFYAETPANTFPVVWESPPKRVHTIPYPSSKLVRPGRSMPDKGSWELQVFQRPDKGIEMYKVFRVDPGRLTDKAKLVDVLTQAVQSKQTGDYENLRVIMTSTATHDGIIPKNR